MGDFRRQPIIAPAQQRAPQPAGMRVETFKHKDFDSIKTDLEAWFALPGLRQLTTINTYPVTALVDNGRSEGIVWHTVIYYLFFL